MKIFVSVAVSVDGYINDTSTDRLVLSCEEDLSAVKTLRAGFDAILVGAETIRKDNPALSSANCNLIKITVSQSGNLDPESRFFSEGTAPKIIITGASADNSKINILQYVAKVIKNDSDTITSKDIIRILEGEGIKNLFVEGGSRILTMFFTENSVNYLRLAIAPFFVGDSKAPRFVSDGKFHFDKDNRMTLLSTRTVGDMAILEYALYTSEDYNMLERAIELSRMSPQSDTAYSVGAVIVTQTGAIFEGYSRETAPDNHAEEEAIIKAEKAGAQLEGATIYSSMEPCSERKSKTISCCEHIVRHKFGKVIFAIAEPPNFVICNTKAILKDAGVEILIIKKLEAKAKLANAHIINNLKFYFGE